MTSFGEATAARVLDEHAAIALAALDGNVDALKALVSVAAQSSYVAGIADAAATTGVLL